MTNKYKDHVFILPEDEANSQLANGFLLGTGVNQRVVQIRKVAGGWQKVLQNFKDDYILGLRRYRQRRIILLVDFDDQDGRYDDIKGKIPSDLQDRVFVIGVSSEPEKLLASVKGLNNLEDIGKALAEDCLNNTSQIWGHDLLKHNQSELQRMRNDIRPFIF